jgi:microsomal dipeptidase-like Zn-dependent dipeptidase
MTGNLLADGCLEPRNAGLTEFGRAVIGVNRNRLLIDLSRRRPLDPGRSTCQRIQWRSPTRMPAPSPRNKTDEAMRALAARGGVIGYSSLPSFVTEDPRDATLARYLDHIDYAVQLVGIEHVGLGLDFVEGHVPGSLQPRAPKWGGANLPAGTAGLAAMLPAHLRDQAEADLPAVRAGNHQFAGDARRHRGLLAWLQRARRPADPRRGWMRLFESTWGG